jgi:hypothetical protein
MRAALGVVLLSAVFVATLYAGARVGPFVPLLVVAAFGVAYLVLRLRRG